MRSEFKYKKEQMKLKLAKKIKNSKFTGSCKKVCAYLLFVAKINDIMRFNMQ